MVTQGALFTEMLAAWKQADLERCIREHRYVEMIEDETRQRGGLRPAIAGWLVRLASRVDAAAAVRSTAALGR